MKYAEKLLNKDDLNTASVTTVIPSWMNKQIEALAYKRGTSKAEVLRYIIKCYFKDSDVIENKDYIIFGTKGELILYIDRNTRKNDIKNGMSIAERASIELWLNKNINVFDVKDKLFVPVEDRDYGGINVIAIPVDDDKLNKLKESVLAAIDIYLKILYTNIEYGIFRGKSFLKIFNFVETDVDSKIMNDVLELYIRMADIANDIRKEEENERHNGTGN